MPYRYHARTEPPSPVDIAIERYVNEGGLLTAQQMREFIRRVGELYSYPESIPEERQVPFGPNRGDSDLSEGWEMVAAGEIESYREALAQEDPETLLPDNRELGTTQGWVEEVKAKKTKKIRQIKITKQDKRSKNAG